MIYINDVPDIEVWLEELVDNFEKMPIIDIKNSILKALQEVYSLELEKFSEDALEQIYIECCNKKIEHLQDELANLQEDYDSMCEDNKELKSRIKNLEKRMVS